MTGAETFDLWWLIPIIMIVLCLFGSRGCCSGRRKSQEQVWSKDQGSPPDSALRILDTCYASGKIDDEEYRRRKSNLYNIFPNEEGTAP